MPEHREATLATVCCVQSGVTSVPRCPLPCALSHLSPSEDHMWSLKLREGMNECVQACVHVYKHTHTLSHARTHTRTHTHAHARSSPKGADCCCSSCAGAGQRQPLSAPEGSVVWKFPTCCFSFTCQLAVKAGQPDGEGLKCTQRVVIVQCEHIISHTTKLHDYVVRVIAMDYLKVLH